MGWWKAGMSEDEIGDKPADVAAAALADIVATVGKPSRAQFMRALVDALAAAGNRTEGKPVLEVTAADTAPEIYTAADSGEAEVAPALRLRMESLVEDLSDVYREQLGRLPRVSEIGAVLAFVLRPRAAQVLADGAGWKLLRIRPPSADGASR